MGERNLYSDGVFVISVLILLVFFLLQSIQTEEVKANTEQFQEQITEIKEYQETLSVETHGEYTSTWMTVEATAYCTCRLCCEEFSDGITAIGRDASIAGVAVDPTVIPYRSRIDIPNITLGPNGNGSWLMADDCGGAIKKSKSKFNMDRIDIRFPSHEEAKEYGRRIILIRVWKKQ